MAQANAQIGVAKAAWFPSLSLKASGGFSSSDLSEWLTAPARVWSLGPAFALTLLDFGARRAQVEQAEASYDEQLAAYRQTVLDAVELQESKLQPQAWAVVQSLLGSYEVNRTLQLRPSQAGEHGETAKLNQTKRQEVQPTPNHIKPNLIKTRLDRVRSGQVRSGQISVGQATSILL
jgi:hypothetical protein